MTVYQLPCPLCEGGGYKLSISRKNVDYVHCSLCGVIPPIDWLESKKENWQKIKNGKFTLKQASFQTQSRLPLLKWNPAWEIELIMRKHYQEMLNHAKSASEIELAKFEFESFKVNRISYNQ